MIDEDKDKKRRDKKKKEESSRKWANALEAPSDNHRLDQHHDVTSLYKKKLEKKIN